ncbi:hypothetical protein [Streptomyces sp. NPDC048825]
MIGQPGASKTETTRMVRRVMRPGIRPATPDEFATLIGDFVD